MRIGIIVQSNDLNPPIVESAAAVETRGFESLWVGEHTHIPVGSAHRYTQGRYQARGWGEEGVVPDFYRRMADPYVTLTAAAAVTTTLRLGTCIALPAEHNPVILAKVIGTLDHISGGRFELGVGYGWNRLEAQNNRIDFADRRAILRENILAMEAIWANEVASFDGEFTSFTDSWSWPKPVQQPRPPVRLGGAPSDRTFGYIIEFADGWVPVDDHVPEGFATATRDLRRRAEEAGRDPASLTVDLVHTPTRMTSGCTVDEFLAGLPSPEKVEEYRELGLHRLLVSPPGDTMDVLRDGLDRLAEIYRDDLS